MALAGAMLMASAQVAQASWIWQWAGPYASESQCESLRQQHIEQAANHGDQVVVYPCGYTDNQHGPYWPGTYYYYSGPGWYYYHGLYAP